MEAETAAAILVQTIAQEHTALRHEINTIDYRKSKALAGKLQPLYKAMLAMVRKTSSEKT